MKHAKQVFWLLVFCACIAGCTADTSRESTAASAPPPEKVVIWTYYETQAQRAGLTLLVESGAMSKDCINWSQNDVALQLAAGKCAMIENGPWVLPLLEESGIPFGIVKLPVDRASIVVQGGENLAVMKGKNVAGALALLDYYYTDDAMLAVNATTYSLPPKRDLAFRMQEQNPVYRVFVEQMDRCVSRPGYNAWPGISPVLSKTLYNVIVGTQTPQEAAAQLARY